MRLRTCAAAAVALTMLSPVALPAAATAAPADDTTVGGPQLAGHGVLVGSGASPLPEVAATSWVVADADTGEVLAAKSPHLPHRPASTLKTLTALTLMPHLDPEAVHEVSAKEMAGVYGSRAGIVAGATYTIDDLWHALLLPSGNDAAAALAGAFGGRKKAVAAMNAEAARLQAGDTHAVNPSGLDADGQVSSAYDLALFARAALAMPEFVDVSGTVSYDLPGAAAKKGKKRHTFKIYGQNRLLNHGYKGVIAGKTGYTSLAGRTFWVAATRGGHTVVVTLMGIQEPTESAAAHLMTWGLRNAGAITPVGTLVDPVPDPPAPDASPTPVLAEEPGGSGLGPGLVAAAPGTSAADDATSHTSLLVLAGLVAVLAVAVLTLARRPRRTAPRNPAVPTGPAPETLVPAPSPAVTTAEPSRPAVVPPTGNVTVVPPPRPEREQPVGEAVVDAPADEQPDGHHHDGQHRGAQQVGHGPP